MSNVFNSVKGLHPKRNAFSSHTYRNDFTGKLGLNIPVYQQHVTAGTRIKVNTAALVRLQALISPVMDNIDYYVHFWKIPYRLLENDEFTKFISGEIDQEEYVGLFLTPFEFLEAFLSTINTNYTTLTYDKRIAVWNDIIADGALLDYLGYDKGLFGTVVRAGSEGNTVTYGNPGNNVTKINFRPIIAYFMLHLHWYMNENVPYFSTFADNVDLLRQGSSDALCSLLIDTHNTFGYTLLPHGWEKDYFTSALPNVQYGDPVSVGLAGSAPVSLNPNSSYTYIDGSAYLGDPNGLYVSPRGITGAIQNLDKALTPPSNTRLTVGENSDVITSISGTQSSTSVLDFTAEDSEGTNIAPMVADLSEASAITINELRFANALQVFKEREQRFGRRRLEYYKGFFDVTPEDLRLQIPAYLGGGRIPINIADIEQTSSISGESRPLGSLAGKGTAVAGSFAGFSTFCSEESIIIGIAFAMPHITYAQHISKFLLKTNDKYDYFNPSFEHLGEQSINNIEIYSGSSNPNGDFGYTPRFNEYRFHANEMHGQFKSSLAYWSLGRIFDSQPALNPSFIYMQPSAFDRIFAVDNQDNMIVSMLFHTKLIQPVSKYGTPRILV